MARKKTGRDKGRPVIYKSEDERPVTVSLRIPRDLAAQMKRYAYNHRQSVTELLLEGLRWRLDEGEDPRWPSQNGKLYYGNTVIREEASDRQPAPPVALAGMDLTPAMLGEDPEALVDASGQPAKPQQASAPVMEQEEPAVLTDDLDAMPLEPDAAPAERPMVAIEGALSAEACPPFDPVKHRLGKLCPRGHAWGTTGQSLRTTSKAGYCLACNAALARDKRQARSEAGVV